MENKNILTFEGVQKSLGAVNKQVYGVDPFEKKFCEGCNDFVPAREFVKEPGLCRAHYADYVRDQEQKWGEPSLERAFNEDE